MSLEAIEKVTKLEARMLEEKAAAETEARSILAEAEKHGLALLAKARSDAADHGKRLAEQAEENAAERTAKVRQTAEAECSVLRAAAEQHMDEAVNLIVGRVVNH